jgi:phospholipase C
VYGPNGFVRAFKGSLTSAAQANLCVKSAYHGAYGISLKIENRSDSSADVSIWDAYGKRRVTRKVRAHAGVELDWTAEDSFGWYDFTLEVNGDASLRVQLAGHVESGRDSMSDPLLGGPAPDAE